MSIAFNDDTVLIKQKFIYEVRCYLYANTFEMEEMKIPPLYSMESEFFNSEQEALKLFEETQKEIMDSISAEEKRSSPQASGMEFDFRLDEEGSPFFPDLVCGLRFEPGEKNFWLDLNDTVHGLVLYKREVK